jgi:hypothetical protein
MRAGFVEQSSDQLLEVNYSLVNQIKGEPHASFPDQ